MFPISQRRLGVVRSPENMKYPLVLYSEFSCSSLCILLGALAAVAFMATAGVPSIFMVLSTATIVVSTLAASALYVSRAFLRLAGRV
jgi:hypothetical protein